MKNLKYQIHYTSGYLMVASLLIVLIGYFSEKGIPQPFLLLMVVSIVAYVFTEKGGDIDG